MNKKDKIRIKIDKVKEIKRAGRVVPVRIQNVIPSKKQKNKNLQSCPSELEDDISLHDYNA